MVTLSSSADSTAVTTCSSSRMPHGLALAFLAAHTATYWNMPERREIDTRIIMPVSRPMVLKSMPRTASAWSSTPTTIIRPAPSSATMARLTFSLMISA